MKRVLIISPHFAPVAAPDGQRARMLVPHLERLGWHPTILTVDPREVASPCDLHLLETLPADADIRRVHAISLARSRSLGVGNLGWRALPAIWREGSRLLARGRYDLVYFSTTQFACVPLGRWWRNRFGVPYVVDLQDPWRNDYYDGPGAAPPPGGWKYRFAAAFAALAEGWSLRKCSSVVTVSPAYLARLANRYPWFDPKHHGHVIPFGWSQCDLQAARSIAKVTDLRSYSRAAINLIYIGRVGDDMCRALRVCFQGFAKWRERNPGADLQILFIGTSYDPNAGKNSTVRKLAEACGVGAAVMENPRRIGYLDALALAQQADANLILGSDDPGYSPSKIWPLLAVGRPWLAITGPATALCSLIKPFASDAGQIIPVTDTDHAIEASTASFDWLLDLTNRARVGRPVELPAELLAFEAAASARRHQQLFDSICP